MNKFQAKKAGLERRKRRVRGKVTGTADRPRLAVHRTNAHIYAASSSASAPSRRALPRSALTAVAVSITVASRLWQTVPATRA